MRSVFGFFSLLTTRTPIVGMLALYALTRNWPLPVSYGAVVLLHELGHALLMLLFGVGVESIKFGIFNGTTTSRRPVSSQIQGGIITLAGPASGLILTLVALAAYQWWLQEPWLLLLAATAAFGNLSNSLPIPPYDGDTIWRLLLSRLRQPLRVSLLFLPSLAAIGVMIWLKFYALLFVFAVIAIASAIPDIITLWDKLYFRRWNMAAESTHQPVIVRPINRRETGRLALAYLGTISGLAVALWYIVTQTSFSLSAVF